MARLRPLNERRLRPIDDLDPDSRKLSLVADTEHEPVEPATDRLRPHQTFFRLVFRREPSKLAALLVKAGERGVETSTYNSVARILEAGWHARMSSRQR